MLFSRKTNIWTNWEMTRKERLMHWDENSSDQNLIIRSILTLNSVYKICKINLIIYYKKMNATKQWKINLNWKMKCYNKRFKKLREKLLIMRERLITNLIPMKSNNWKMKLKNGRINILIMKWNWWDFWMKKIDFPNNPRIKITS